jgi:predicted enzyme related to lactoylglutathione lyase
MWMGRPPEAGVLRIRGLPALEERERAPQRPRPVIEECLQGNNLTLVKHLRVLLEWAVRFICIHIICVHMTSEIRYKLGMVTLFCRGVAEMKKFYINNLGLTEIKEMTSPTFATLMTDGGSLIGLQDVKTSLGGQASTHGEVELGLEVEDVDATYRRWKANSSEVTSPPMDLPFGRTFQGKDPEGHLLRIYNTKKR